MSVQKTIILRRALVPSSFLFLVVRPRATFLASLLLVAKEKPGVSTWQTAAARLSLVTMEGTSFGVHYREAGVTCSPHASGFADFSHNSKWCVCVLEFLFRGWERAVSKRGSMMT